MQPHPVQYKEQNSAEKTRSSTKRNSSRFKDNTTARHYALRGAHVQHPTHTLATTRARDAGTGTASSTQENAPLTKQRRASPSGTQRSAPHTLARATGTPYYACPGTPSCAADTCSGNPSQTKMTEIGDQRFELTHLYLKRRKRNS